MGASVWHQYQTMPLTNVCHDSFTVSVRATIIPKRIIRQYKMMLAIWLNMRMRMLAI